MNYILTLFLVMCLILGCGNGSQKDSAVSNSDSPPVPESVRPQSESELIVKSLQQSLNDPQRPAVKIRLLGDSITWGMRVSGEANPDSTPRTHSLSDARNNLTSPSWANLLRDYLQMYAGTTKKVIVGNDGIVGTSSSDWLPGKELLDNAVQTDDEFIILMIGTNDRADDVQPQTPAKTYSNVKTIVEHLRNVHHKKVILMSANQVSQDETLLNFTMAQVRDAIQKASIDCDVPFINHFAVNQLSDSVHPNDAGHYQMFLNIVLGLGI